MARASNYAENRVVILGVLAEAQDRHSPAPSVRDLALVMNVGVATVHSYLRQLAKEGMVEWTPNRHRSLRLTPEGSQLVSSQVTPSA